MSARLAFTISKYDAPPWPQVSGALCRLRPECAWGIEGEECMENLKWDPNNEQSPPTQEEVDAEISKLEQENIDFYLRRERDIRLYETDWVVTKYTELGEPIPEEWRTYRQALRDITTSGATFDPNHSTLLGNVDWPVKPE